MHHFAFGVNLHDSASGVVRDQHSSVLQRQETRNAGYAAGLDVLSIINEPTAAALAYGRTLHEDKKILVFDLGGGTFDVTILDLREGEGLVVASDGADQLGGKDWDEVIMDYLYSEFRRRTGKDIPDDMGWEIQQLALRAKFDLTEHEETTVSISNDGADVEIILYRADPSGPASEYEFDMDTDRPFYFEERSSNLLSLCRTFCIRVIEKAGLKWGDIDDIILAGGACRMPMIPLMLEELVGRKVSKHIPGFSFDTAIAMGAALSCSRKHRIRDVTSKTIGVEVKINGRPYIEHLIQKNKPLPFMIEEDFKAESNAVLKVYEGESHVADECILRGRLELGNPEGSVKVTMNINNDGVLSSMVEFPPNERLELNIRTDDEDIDLNELRLKIAGLDFRL